MRVVLDTNILISAFLFAGKQRTILSYAIEGRYKIASSLPIIREIEKVLLRPKFNCTAAQTYVFIEELIALAEMWYPSITLEDICRDQKDHIILECAQTSNANFIVTGDKDLLVLSYFQNIPIINSDDFLRTLDTNNIPNLKTSPASMQEL